MRLPAGGTLLYVGCASLLLLYVALMRTQRRRGQDQIMRLGPAEPTLPTNANANDKPAGVSSTQQLQLHARRVSRPTRVDGPPHASTPYPTPRRAKTLAPTLPVGQANVNVTSRPRKEKLQRTHAAAQLVGARQTEAAAVTWSKELARRQCVHQHLMEEMRFHDQ